MALERIGDNVFRLLPNAFGSEAERSEVGSPAIWNKKYALARLCRDFQECLDNPLPGVTAAPISENNYFNWHCNVRGFPGSDFEGCNFHLAIKFPNTYPRNSPRVSLMTYMRHKNVYGEWICLDMLENDWIADLPTEKKSDLFTGWSSAYSVQSVLLQLQSFLFQKDKFYSQTAIAISQSSARDFKCHTCNHTND
eukprot:963137_1